MEPLSKKKMYSVFDLFIHYNDLNVQNERGYQT